MKKLTLIFLITGGILNGCTMIPDYLRPDFAASPTWGNVSSNNLPEGVEENTHITWPDFFRSPELQKIISITLENNKDLKTAALNIEESRATYRIQRADLLPNIKAGGNGTIQKSSDNSSLTGRGVKTQLYTSNIGLSSYEIDLFGKIRSLNEAALNDYLATAEAKNALKNTLIAETANAYLQLLADRKLLSLTEKTVISRNKTYEILSKSMKSGVANQLDVERASTLIESAKVDREQYKRFVAQDTNALILLMGIKHEKAFMPETSLDDVEIMENLQVALPSEVLLRRPDVRRAEFELMARNANIGAARAAFFPSISLTGEYGFASDDLSTLFSGGAAGAWSLMPKITLPIFEGGRNKANLSIAEIRKEKAILHYEHAIQTAFQEIMDELVARSTLREQLKAQQRLVAATQQVHDLSNARYKVGIDNFLSVLDARRELYTAEKDAILIQHQCFSNLVNLYKVLGGGSVMPE